METSTQWKTWHKAIIFVLLALIFVVSAIVISEPAKEKPKPSIAELHKKKVESQFSGYDGSHINLTKLIKANLNDPSSFEHVKTTWYELDDSTLYVMEEYRAKNGFGALVLSETRAEVKTDGTIVKLY